MNRLDEELSELDSMIEMAQAIVVSGSEYRDKNKQEFQEFFTIYDGVMQLRKLVQDQVRAEIEDLQKEYDSYTGGSDKALELKEIVKQEGQLQQECSTLQERKEELSSECKGLEGRCSQLKSENDRLQEKKDRLDNETTVVLPLKREELRLLMSISGIIWNFEGSTDKVEGYITNKSDVKNFSFDKTVSSQFTMTNSLWDSMCED